MLWWQFVCVRFVAQAFAMRMFACGCVSGLFCAAALVVFQALCWLPDSWGSAHAVQLQLQLQIDFKTTPLMSYNCVMFAALLWLQASAACVIVDSFEPAVTYSLNHRS